MQLYQCWHLVCWLYPQTCSPFTCLSARLNLAACCCCIESNLFFKVSYKYPKYLKLSRILAAQMHHLTALRMLTETFCRYQWHNVPIQNLYQHVQVLHLEWNLLFAVVLFGPSHQNFLLEPLCFTRQHRFFNFDLVRWTWSWHLSNKPVWRTKFRGAMASNTSHSISNDAMKIFDVMAMNIPNASCSFFLL